MVFDPFKNLRVLVSGIVVDDHMHRFLLGRPGIDDVEEADELLMAMALHTLMTLPSNTSSAANSVVMPCRFQSWVMGPARPFFIGSPGWVRSSAWIWLTWGFVGQDVQIGLHRKFSFVDQYPR